MKSIAYYLAALTGTGLLGWLAFTSSPYLLPCSIALIIGCVLGATEPERTPAPEPQEPQPHRGRAL